MINRSAFTATQLRGRPPMDLTSAVGYVAALCSTISFSPQAIKIIRERRTDDISAATYAITVGGFVLWTAYGILLGEWPLILSNAICLVLSAFILFMKLAPQRKKEAVADALDPPA